MAYYRPMIHTANGTSTKIYLPPTLDWSITRSQRNTIAQIPKRKGALLLETLADVTNIRISGMILGLTVAGGQYTFASGLARDDAMSIWDEIEAGVIGAPFHLYRWTDRCWTDCVIASPPIVLSEKPDDVFSFELNINALNPTELKTGLDNGDVGKWDSFSSSSTGGTTPAVAIDTQTISGFFPGLAVTNSTPNTEFRKIVQGTAGADYTVRRVGVSAIGGAQPTSYGPTAYTDTTITFSNAAIGGGGDTMTVTIDGTPLPANGPWANESTSGAFTVTVGNYLYAWVSSGGSFSDIQFYADLDNA